MCMCFFLPLSLPSPSSLRKIYLPAIVAYCDLIMKFCYHDYVPVMSHFSSLNLLHGAVQKKVLNQTWSLILNTDLTSEWMLPSATASKQVSPANKLKVWIPYLRPMYFHRPKQSRKGHPARKRRRETGLV